jgi:steroid delta-isomerase-like uncharacterized protein
MSLEENKTVIRKMIEAINKQNLSSLDELIATDFVYHMPVEQIQGLEVMKQDIEEEIKAFPDWHETIEDILAEGDKVCFRVKLTGTHTGEYYGLAPTGKKITYTAVAICRIVDGKIVEGWGVYDMLDFYKQLGAIEYTEKGKKLFPEDVK